MQDAHQQAHHLRKTHALSHVDCLIPAQSSGTARGPAEESRDTGKSCAMLDDRWTFMQRARRLQAERFANMTLCIFRDEARLPMTFSCTIPAVPTVQRDDEDVRITRWDFVPGAATGWHLHGWPYFVVMLIGGVLRVHDGQNVSERTLVQGQTYDRPSGIEHDVMNGSPHPIAFVEIEIKRPQAIPFH
jgi:mannose-6-phosphate isomerase-like protein (cupin superfamily)